LDINYEHFKKLVRECEIVEVKELAERSTVVTAQALIVNSGGWLVYLVPILLIAISFTWIQMLATKLLIGLTEKEVNTAFPDERVAFASPS
jgi:hypothetical protein